MPESPGVVSRPVHADPLGAADYAALARAGQSLRPVRRGERIAGSSGLVTLLAGLASLPFVLGSGVGLALAVSLCVIGWREMWLRKNLRSLEPLACGRLARNQLLLGGSLALYAVVQLIRGPGSIDSITGGQLDQMPELAASADGVMKLVHIALYAGMVVGAVVVQGSQAAYYTRVGTKLRKAYADNPMWVMRVHAAAWGGATPNATGVRPEYRATPATGGEDAPARAAA